MCMCMIHILERIHMYRRTATRPNTKRRAKTAQFLVERQNEFGGEAVAKGKLYAQFMHQTKT